MIINEKILKELESLKKEITDIQDNSSLTDLQLESFFRNFEKRRYNILSEIKQYNKNLEFEYEKIKTVDANYRATINNDILKIYVPETMPGYKNLKTHTYKRILLNIAEITRKYKGLFSNPVFIYIKVFDNIDGWDIDNKYVKPVADALISSGVIKDDDISRMFYCAKGEFSSIPHTEIYVFESKLINEFLEKYIS